MCPEQSCDRNKYEGRRAEFRQSQDAGIVEDKGARLGEEAMRRSLPCSPRAAGLRQSVTGDLIWCVGWIGPRNQEDLLCLKPMVLFF